MYQFSRSMYRELSGLVTADPRYGSVDSKQRLLQACESTVERLTKTGMAADAARAEVGRRA